MKHTLWLKMWFVDNHPCLSSVASSGSPFTTRLRASVFLSSSKNFSLMDSRRSAVSSGREEKISFYVKRYALEIGPVRYDNKNKLCSLTCGGYFK